ncbi:MAG: hypothetical protein HGA59_03140 [Chlorobiaceae bacterium]|jgi:hypothetical protein|nr:hypothetical protein [Chlorobiaceae bacterium]NTV16270.1 hypothetical protein [Chlorobiaceae bacterium]
MMTKRNENIEKKVSETMKLLDEMGRVEVNHLFRVRLMQRVEREFGEGAGRAHSRFGNRVDVRLAFMTLLLIINLGSALLSVFDSNRQTTTTLSELLDNQSDDYSSQEFAYYDQTVTEPAVGTERNLAP